MSTAYVRAIALGIFLIIAGVAYSPLCDEVGERAPSPSHGVTIDTPRPGSEAAPARSLETGASGSQGTGRADSEPEHPVWSAVVEGGGVASERPAPASTVTQSALTGEGGSSLYGYNPSFEQPRPTVNVSPTDGGASIAPATPVATAHAVETLAPKSINSYDPWPPALWPVIECLIERESGGRAWEVSPGGDVGLMQIGPANFVWLAERGITRAMLFDGPTNIRAGWLLYVWWEGVNGDGLTPWKSTRGGCA